MTNAETAKVFKALSDESRIEILQFLKEGELCACMLLDKLNIGQSTLSHHMKILCDSGIVTGRKDGKWTHYRIDEKGSCNARLLLEQLTNGKCCADINQ